MQSLEQSEDPTDQNLADILQTLSRLDRKVEKMEKGPSPPSQRRLESRRKKFGEREISLEIGGIEYTFNDDEIELAEIKSIAQKSSVPTPEVKMQIQRHPVLSIAD